MLNYSIFQNIKQNFNTKYLNEKHFKKLNIDDNKDLGLSKNKAKTIKELSERYLRKDFIDLSKMNNDELNYKLLSVFGIGPWSVNMFEIFCLGKQNIFSSRDAGLRLAMNKAGMVKDGVDWELYDIYAEKWLPFRTIASLHLWKTVD